MNAYTLAQLPAAYQRAQAINRRLYVTPHAVDTDALITALDGVWAQQQAAWINQAAAALRARIPAPHLARHTETVWEYVFYELGQDWECPDRDEPDAADWTAQGMAAIRWWHAWQRAEFPALDYTPAELAAWLADHTRTQLRLF